MNQNIKFTLLDYITYRKICQHKKTLLHNTVLDYFYYLIYFFNAISFQLFVNYRSNTASKIFKPVCIITFLGEKLRYGLSPKYKISSSKARLVQSKNQKAGKKKYGGSHDHQPCWWLAIAPLGHSTR